MKNLVKSAAVAVLLFLAGCDKPNPVELDGPAGSSDEQSTIEVLSANPEESGSPYGYDTTAFFRPEDASLRYGSALIIARNRLFTGDSVSVTSFAELYIYDRTQPVTDAGGRTVTYKTKKADFLRINNFHARETSHMFRWRRGGGSLVDSLLGPKYRLFGKRGLLSPEFELDANAEMDIRIKMPGQSPVQITASLPEEITGSVKRVKLNGADAMMINWNGAGSGHVVEVLIGARHIATGLMIPFYRITTRDDGQYIVPPSLLRVIPPSRFDAPGVTLLRKAELVSPLLEDGLYISAFSAYTIRPGN
ncbi:MAG: hypothetical protein AMXMBFR48_18200 [Ignavibacteriales bacterium]